MRIPFSWGSKGDILFPWKENIPLNRPPARCRGNPALSTCAAQDGSLTLTDSDGSTQSGTYTLTQHDANDVLYDLTLDSETGTALVGVTEYTDAAGEKSSEYTLILSLPEQTVYFRADMAQ